jgi:DNA-binding response OmpR family regulator
MHDDSEPTSDSEELLQGTSIRIGNLLLRPGDPQVLIRDKPIYLHRQELVLLELLARHAGQVQTTEALAYHLSRSSKPLTREAVAVQVHRLRARLKSASVHIATLRGVGYLLQATAPTTRWG